MSNLEVVGVFRKTDAGWVEIVNDREWENYPDACFLYREARRPEALTKEAVGDAAYAFRDSLVPRADHHSGGGRYPMWHGWAIYDAFLAGADFARRPHNGSP